MISIYNSVESPIKDIEILGNTVDGVSVGILQDDGQYKITLFTNNGLDNMSPDYREDKEELLLPCQLEKIGDSTDRLYYDKEEKAWCIYKVSQSKIVLPITFTISLNSFYGTTNLYMVSGEVEGTIKAKVSKSLGASVSSLNDKADVLIDKIDAMLGGKVDLDGYATIEYVDVKDGEIKNLLEENKTEIEANKTSILSFETELSKTENTSYTTTNGIKEFECKDGYVDNVVIEGETLVNLYKRNTEYSLVNGTNSTGGFNTGDNYDYLIVHNISGVETFVYSEHIPQIQLGKEYTLIVDVDEITGGSFEFFHEGDLICGGSSAGLVKVKFTSKHNSPRLRFDANDLAWVKFKNIMILEGDHTDKHISYFEGLKSVGQGDKIEVLTYQKDKERELDFTFERADANLNDGTFVPNNTTTNAGTSFIYVCGGKVRLSRNGHIFLYDKNFKFIRSIENAGTSTFNVNEAIYIRIWYAEYDMEIKIYHTPYLDKKQISTTLRSLPNGVKDTIEKRGNKYYKIKKCEEVALNGNENWVLSQTNTNCIKFDIQSYTSIKLAPNGLCDKFNWENGALVSDYEFIGGHGSSQMIRCSILKSKLSTQDVQGFKTWLSRNPVTVVYELETPIIEELPNFNPQTFSDKTTLLLNSGVVQAEASFEVTNSLGSELEVLKGKVSDLDDTSTIINSHTTPYSTIQYSSLNDIPLKPGRYGIGCKDSSFPTEYGNFTIDYGSYRGEFIGTFRSMTSTNMWISVNRYGDINDRGWKPWQQITTTSTLSLLEQQISELEIQLLENEV